MLRRAVQSWLCGRVLARFDPAAFQLHSSRGYETPWSKVLMRWSVVVADIFGAPPPPPPALPVMDQLGWHALPA